MKKIKYAWHSFIQLLFPLNCAACDEPLRGQEETLCFYCIVNLPTTQNWEAKENSTYKKMYGRFEMQYASAFLYFTKTGITQHLIHQLKYRRRQDVAIYLGNLFGQHLLNSNWIKQIDVLIPVPLHPKKERQRGYNQSTLLASGIEEITGVPICKDILIKIKDTPSQTKKTIAERIENVNGTFQVRRPETLRGKHVLLVDDVLTTGSTIETCALALLSVPEVKVSFVTLGVVLE